MASAGSALWWGGIFSSSHSRGQSLTVAFTPGSSSMCLEHQQTPSSAWCAIPTPAAGPALAFARAAASSDASNTSSAGAGSATVAAAIDLLLTCRSSQVTTAPISSSGSIPSRSASSTTFTTKPPRKHALLESDCGGCSFSAAAHESNSASSMLCSFAPLPPANRHSSATVHDLVGSPPVVPLQRLKTALVQPAAPRSCSSTASAAGIPSSTSTPTASPATTPTRAVKLPALSCPPAPKRPPPSVALLPRSELVGCVCPA